MAARRFFRRFRRLADLLWSNLDSLIGVLLFLGGFYAYLVTLAPTVLEGDAALFQYTPYVLGVTYPTGYPFYILLGKLWLTLFPFGEIAWRMNLFSALCSAAALPLIYSATRRLLASTEEQAGPARWAALATVLTFATLPTFWRWSTESKIYALNILLFSGVLYSLAPALEATSGKQTPKKGPVGKARFSFPILTTLFKTYPLALPAFLLGLQISVHSTTVLLLPGLLLLVWLHFRNRLDKKRGVLYALLLIVPGLLYLYVPLRAEALIARYGRAEAIARGLLADFYHSGWSGWVRYFTAADFTGGVVSNWGLVPHQFLSVYLPDLLGDNFPPLAVILSLIGGLGMAVRRARLFWPLFLIYAAPIPFVLTYGQGEQSAFLLPSFLIFSVFTGHALLFTVWLLDRLAGRWSRAIRSRRYVSGFLPALILLVLIPLLFLPQTHYNLNRLNAKWSRAIYNEWADNLSHPMEPRAAMLAHWGDLTPFWYMQYAEEHRPDLLGLYPPTEEVVADYLGGAGDLYIAGPLQGWAAGIEERYQLIPWGRLVRIAPRQTEPATLLPPLPYSFEVIFNDRLRLLGGDYPAQAVSGQDYPVILTWQALAALPPETSLSLRFIQGEGIVTQLDDTLLSGWFPRDSLPPGQLVLSYARIPIPLGTLPGKYRLQLVTYAYYKDPWPLADGNILLELGEVEIVSPPADYRPDGAQFATIPGYDFGGEIELADYRYTVSRVGQGKGFGVELLWRAKTKPQDSYTLLAEVVDGAGRVIRSVKHQPVGGMAPTSGWQAGQFVRDQVDLVLPASAPVGPNAVRVRLSWLRPDGSKLPVRRWLFPAGHNLELDWLKVTEKERVFEVPEIEQPLEFNFGNKVRLLGYNSPHLLDSEVGEEDSARLLRLNQANCPAGAAPCQIHLDFYWQGLSEMDLLYFVFLHLVDEQGRIVAQHDRSPGKRGKQPTTSWLPGEVIADPVDLPLPPDIPPGRYSLRLGLYLPPDGPRLPVLNDNQQSDFIEVGTLQIEP